MKKFIFGIICVFLVFSIISYGNANLDSNPEIKLDISVVDESGQGIANATIQSSDNSFTADENGNLSLTLKEGPDVLLISGKGFLTETVPIGWDDNNQSMEVKLLSDAGGQRVTINFGGDVMLGRRYLDTSNESPISMPTNTTEGALNVVKHLDRAFSSADISCVNLESVIGEFNRNEAYKGKRWLLQSPPEAIDALKSLGVDLVSLANNHIRDWGDQGVDSTIKELANANIVTVGAGDEKTSREPVLIEKKGIKIGTLAYTSVTGSFVNNFLPDNEAVKPDYVEQGEEWIWEKRTWEWSGTDWSMPKGEYRAGEVWNVYNDVKSKLSSDVQTKIWGSLIKTYPELQNWVARHGQSGAAQWRSKESVKEIKELREKADILVVQLHSGFQFKTSPSEVLIDAAHKAIDAGADIVIGHHPHVLQGMEWYKGRLIVYSLGNMVFDQNFLDTFPSGFLKTVWEKDKLIEARFIPIQITDYKPIVETGTSAKQIINQVWESSILPAQTKRYDDYVYTVKTERDEESKPVQFRFEWGTARLAYDEHKENCTLDLDTGETINLDNDSLYPARLGQGQEASKGQILIGRDLLRWGHFEDTLADMVQNGAAHFSSNQSDVWKADNEEGFIRLLHNSKKNPTAMIRPVARIPIVDNRLYDESYSPLDSDVTYTLRLAAKGKGEVSAHLRVDSYWFYDGNPLEDPVSELLGQKKYDIEISDEGWQTIEVPFELLEKGDKQANSIMVYVELDTPSTNRCILDIDDLEVVEWREASLMPDIYGAYTHVKNIGKPIHLEFDTLSLSK
ncbi:CapA family protein [Schnuerera sp. xch1]|uniref:CapA family protein n=1 Tax=Schnuerera sp. xch1 TaxID=2874283 RepID=UPI001CBCDDA9|nr:CapA family protein [Schnuerera sp. xch1]MBZ2174662.1 CapA family protein [Schnuerera sp. xch1]